MVIMKNEGAVQTEPKPLPILESIPDGFISVDQDWIIRYCNRNSEIILGLPKESMIGVNVWNRFPGCENLKFYSAFHKAVELQQPVHFEEYYDPLKLWVQVSASPSRNFLSVYFRDVTAQKEQQERLKEMNKRFNQVLNFISESIWEWEIGAPTAIWHSDNLAKLLGYDQCDQGLVELWEKSVHPNDLAGVQENFRRTLELGDCHYTHQYRLRKKTGEYIHVRDRAQIIRNGKGAPVKVIGVTDDITVQKRYEEALIRAKESYQSLFDDAPLPQWIYDQETLHFLDVNKAAIHHYGYSREEFLQMTLLDIRPEEDHQKLIETVKNRSARQQMQKRTWTHFKKNGEKITVEVSLTLLQYQLRTAHLATLNDITEIRSLQQQLTSEKLDRQKSITKAVFTAQENERSEIGKELHDNINQILTTAKLFAENVIHIPEKKEQFVAKTVCLVQKAINEIRFISKSLVTPTISDLGFAEALQEMIDCYGQLNLFKIDFKLTGCMENVEKDRTLTIYRILQEQLNNIVKYAQASLVRIHLLFEKHHLHILIEDNGIGFDTAQTKKGLGLNNIKNRAELFKGRLRIKTEKDKGCKMEVWFPLQ
jgi:PAS domain S-box-containing protein